MGRVGNLRSTALSTAFAVLLCILSTCAAQAAPTPSAGLTITPATLAISLASHTQQQSATITLTNHYRVAITLQFSIQSSLAGQATEADKTALQQVTVERPSFTLNPNESATQTITLTDNQRLAPGSQRVDLVVQQMSDSNSQVGVQASMRVPLILVKEAGAISSLALTDTSQSRLALHLPSTITATLHNTGNMIVVPRGVITVRDLSGKVIGEGTINTSSRAVNPGQTFTTDTPLTKLGNAVWPGVYRIETTYGLGGDQRGQTATTAFLYLAWWHLAGLALIAVAVVAALHNRARIIKLFAARTRRHPVMAGRHIS